MAFVDHHRAVLGAGYLIFVHGLDDGFHFPLPIGGVTLNDVHVIGFTLQAAPFVEVVHLYFLFNAFFGDEAAQPGGQGDVEAQHQDGFGDGLGQVQAAVAEDQGFAGAGNAVDDAVAVAHAFGDLFLLQVHDADDVGDD